MNYLTIVCCVFLLAAGISTNKINVAECLRNGGRCMEKCECKFKQAVENVCGEKQSCCYIVKEEDTCRSRGGECINNCPEKILHYGAGSKDCADGLDCCVWTY